MLRAWSALLLVLLTVGLANTVQVVAWGGMAVAALAGGGSAALEQPCRVCSLATTIRDQESGDSGDAATPAPLTKLKTLKLDVPPQVVALATALETSTPLMVAGDPPTSGGIDIAPEPPPPRG